MLKRIVGRWPWLASFALLLLLGTPAVAAQRVALVIGNGTYANVQRLANPVDDARAVATALTKLGFDVDLQLDLDRAGMWRAVKQLATRAEKAEAALLFYAGHGAQKDRIAYLIPTDAALDSELDLPGAALELNLLLARLDKPGRATLVFLDACRNDPFGATAGASRGLIASSGVGQVSAPSGMLIAYATGEGDTAADGRDRNSPFTKALLEQLATPGVEVRDMLTKVRQKELAATGGRQSSETADRLLGDFYFSPPKPAPVQAQPAPPAPDRQPTLADQPDYKLWMAIQGSTDPALFKVFLDQYPDSPIAPAARTRLVSLERAALRTEAKPAETKPVPPEPASPEKKSQIAALSPPIEAPEPVRALPPAGAEVGYVTTTVTLRQGRGSRTAKLGPLQPGAAVTVAGRQRGWAEVWTADNRHGFVPDKYLAATAEAAAAAARPTRDQRRTPGEMFRDCANCPELVATAPGTFTMGSPEREAGRDWDEGPQRAIQLMKPLAIGRFEVTFAEWDACVADGGCGGYRPDDRGWGRDSRPVIGVSFADASAYAEWLSRKTGKRYRLPSEAEWEYAARAGDTGPNPWNDDDSGACRYANLYDETSAARNGFDWTAARCADGQPATAPVGSYAANGFGLGDMLGNVAEWTADCWHETLADLPPDGTAATNGGDCSQRVLRGGHWRAYLDGMRYANRTAAPMTARSTTDGFRVIRDLDEGLREGAGAPVVAGGS